MTSLAMLYILRASILARFGHIIAFLVSRSFLFVGLLYQRRRIIFALRISLLYQPQFCVSRRWLIWHTTCSNVGGHLSSSAELRTWYLPFRNKRTNTSAANIRSRSAALRMRLFLRRRNLSVTFLALVFVCRWAGIVDDFSRRVVVVYAAAFSRG